MSLRSVDANPPAWWIAFVSSVLLLALKAPDALFHAQFWAEDGVIFFVGQRGKAMPQVFADYAHYLHAVPRGVAWSATALSSASAPLVYNASAIVLGAAALASLRRWGSLGPGFAFTWLALALTPTNGEVFGTLTNVQWLLQLYLIAFLGRLIRAAPSHRPLLRCAAMAGVGLTGPFSCFVAPVATCVAVWMTHRAGRRSPLPRSLMAELVVLLICASLQAIFIATSAGSVPGGPVMDAAEWTTFVASLQVHVFGTRLLPTGVFLAIVAFAVVAACRTADTSQRVFLSAWLACVGLALLATAFKFAGNAADFLSFGYGDRYYLLFKASFWWLIALAFARGGSVPRPRVGALAAGVLLVTTAVLTAAPLRRKPLDDLHWQNYAGRIDAGEAVDVPINPPPWRMAIPSEH